MSESHENCPMGIAAYWLVLFFAVMVPFIAVSITSTRFAAIEHRLTQIEKGMKK